MFCFIYKKIIKREKKNTHWTLSCLKIYFNVYLVIVIFFLNFMNLSLFLNFIYTLKYTFKLIITLNFFFYFMIFAFKVFFPSFFKVDLHSTNVRRATDAIRWQMFFFQSPLEASKMFSLPKNLFCLLTVSSH